MEYDFDISMRSLLLFFVKKIVFVFFEERYILVYFCEERYIRHNSILRT